MYIANDDLALTIHQNGALTLADKKNSTNWQSNFIGWVELTHNNQTEKIALNPPVIVEEPEHRAIRLEFHGLFGQFITDNDFELIVRWQANNNALTLEILSAKTAYWLQSIEYPAHFINVASGLSDSAVFIPHLQGIMIPARYDAGFMRYGQNIWRSITNKEHYWTFESGNLNMPWFGATNHQSSLFVHMETSTDCQLHVIGNAMVNTQGQVVSNRYGDRDGTRLSSLSPRWLSSKGDLSYPRKLSIYAVNDSYTGMTRCYKEIAKSNGRYVTLAEKIKKNPEYEKIIGAPDIKIYCYTNRKDEPVLRAWSEPILTGYEKVNTTFHQVQEIIADLKAMNVEKCLIILGGWNRMGYDREHVDMWPPAEQAGGIDALRDAARLAKDYGYLFALHDNYDDFYPDAPTFDESTILRDADGSLHQGGIWDGGICYITCPAKRVDLLNRNMQLVTDHIPLTAYYFDVITNTSHYECYDSDHPITRDQDLRHRLELIKNIRDRDLVVGGERGTDWALPDLAFCEGLSGGGAEYHYGVCYRTGITVPLFYLVYHECVVGYWQHGTPHGREDHANHVLMDLLNIQPSSWSIEYSQWNDIKPRIQECYELLGALHRKTAHAAMTFHEFLTDDLMVQHTVFDDDTQVWVNFGHVTYIEKHLRILPKGFLIQNTAGDLIRGTVSRSINLINS